MPISGSPSLTGKRIIVLRAVSPSGVESKESLTLELEYKDGYIVRPAPNTPQIRSEATVEEFVFTVYITYDASNQKSYPVKFAVYLTPIDTNDFDWDNPVAYFNVDTIVGTIITQDLEVDPGAIAAGEYLYAVRAIGLDGISEQNVNSYRIRLGDEVPNDVGDFDSAVQRD